MNNKWTYVVAFCIWSLESKTGLLMNVVDVHSRVWNNLFWCDIDAIDSSLCMKAYVVWCNIKHYYKCCKGLVVKLCLVYCIHGQGWLVGGRGNIAVCRTSKMTVGRGQNLFGEGVPSLLPIRVLPWPSHDHVWFIITSIWWPGYPRHFVYTVKPPLNNHLLELSEI